MLRSLALSLGLLVSGPAVALTFDEIRADPRWTCALYRARGDFLAAKAARSSRPSEAGTPGASDRPTRALRRAAERGDPVAVAALGWWRRADAAGCE